MASSLRPSFAFALLLAFALVLVPSFASSGASGAPTFRMHDTGTTGVELNLGVAPNGHIFVGGWNHIARSTDDGVSWAQTMTLPVVVAADRTLRVDHATGHVFTDDTYLGCTILSASGDEGATWTRNPVACGASATDHEKIAVGPRPVGSTTTALDAVYNGAVYVCANGLVTDACGSSLDGGITMLPLPPHGVSCAYQGQPYVSAQGVLLEASNACGANLRTSADGGLTWVSHNVAVSLDAGSGNVPVIATTPDGTIYFMFMTPQFRPAFVYSHDGGTTWSAPTLLSPAGVTSTVFPVIVGGDNGRIAVAYYGTSGWTGDPGAAPGTSAWDGYIGIVTDADTAAPVVQTTRVTSDPLHFGCVSKQGGCGGDPIADYMDIDVGPDGRVYAIFMDAWIGGAHVPARGIIAVQTGGTNLHA